MSNVPELEGTRQALIALRSDLDHQRRDAPTPAIAHALKLADTYLFMALGYTGHNDQLFAEEGSADLGGDPFPNLR
jgi:hypothetical protein